jgi:hypothetical protein
VTFAKNFVHFVVRDGKMKKGWRDREMERWREQGKNCK